MTRFSFFTQYASGLTNENKNSERAPDENNQRGSKQ